MNTRCFKVLDNNKLQSYTFDYSNLQNLQSAPVRVVSKTRKKNPYPSIAHMCDIMWLQAKDPIARLTWDPGGGFGDTPWGKSS